MIGIVQYGRHSPAWKILIFSFQNYSFASFANWRFSCLPNKIGSCSICKIQLCLFHKLQFFLILQITGFFYFAIYSFPCFAKYSFLITHSNVFETIYFSNKAAHQGTYENPDVLHQHFWLVKDCNL